MQKCWDMQPDMRPTFAEIHEEIESLYKTTSGDMYYYQK